MKTKIIIGCLLLGLCICGCGPRQPRARHVIILGFDAMGARDIQRAKAPCFNHLIENGAVSLHTRCVRETVSGQNWMSMVSGAPIEIHGVFTNGWNPGKPENVPPARRVYAGYLSRLARRLASTSFLMKYRKLFFSSLLRLP